MDFNSLTPENQEKYLALEKKMFSDRKPLLSTACKQLRIPYFEGFMWWSYMQKNHASPIPEPVIYAKKPAATDSGQPLCPSCGRSKDAVTDTHICRDVFHYINN